MRSRKGLKVLWPLVVTGLLLGVADDSPPMSHSESMMGGMMPMMQMCHQMMQGMMGGGMGMMGMMGREHNRGPVPGPMSPEGQEIAKLRADAEVKEAQLRRMLLEVNINPDALKGKIREIHDLQVEIQFREIMHARAEASAQKSSDKEESKEDHAQHHMGGMGMMGK